METRIRFETKEESNSRRESEFMALSAYQRVEWFLRNCDRCASSTGMKVSDSENFIIRKRADAVR